MLDEWESVPENQIVHASGEEIPPPIENAHYEPEPLPAAIVDAQERYISAEEANRREAQRQERHRAIRESWDTLYVERPEADQESEFQWMMGWTSRLERFGLLLVEAGYAQQVEQLEAADTRSRVAVALLTEAIDRYGYTSVCELMQVIPEAVDWWNYFDRGFPEILLEDTVPAMVALELKEARHSPDFASVYWFGAEYEFTSSQAACVKVLWEAWEYKTPVVGESTILENAEVSSALRIVFRKHRAWGTMIVPASTKGRFRLQEPSD